MEFDGHSILFLYIPEQFDKPVYIRGSDLHNSYCRSAGQTVKMSRYQIKTTIAILQGIPFEYHIAKADLTYEQVVECLNYQKFYELINKAIPDSAEIIVSNLQDYRLC